MSIVSRASLKSWFRRGSKPTEEQFTSLIDSLCHKSEDSVSASIFEHDPAIVYQAGQYAVQNGSLYRATTPTQGELNIGAWELASASVKMTFFAEDLLELFRTIGGKVLVAPHDNILQVNLVYSPQGGNGIIWNNNDNYFYAGHYRVPLGLLTGNQERVLRMELRPVIWNIPLTNEFRLTFDPSTSVLEATNARIILYIYYIDHVMLL